MSMAKDIAITVGVCLFTLWLVNRVTFLKTLVA